jgi:nucleoside-diphosphate-sugar epimerase
MGSVLVTGGLGFLGRHLCRRLVADGESVDVLARPSPRAQSAPVPEGVGRVWWSDVRDAEAVSEAVAGHDAVIHLVSNFRNAREDGAEAHDVNVGGTRNVLDACLRHGVEHLVHCSTIGVHGSVREVPATEVTEFNPGDSYQRTKLEAEQLAWETHRSEGLPVTVIRPISMMGPGDRRMLKLFRMINSGWFVRIGAGEALFQPAYVDDVVEGFVLALRNPRGVGEAFIVGGDEYVTINALARLIAAELEVDLRVLPVPMRPVLAAAWACETLCAPLGVEPPLHRRRVSFYQNSRAFSIDKARRLLGYSPRASLAQALHETAAWYRKEGWL